MTRVQLEKKYDVQIDSVRSAYKSKHMYWAAYKGDREIARGKRLSDLQVALEQAVSE